MYKYLVAFVLTMPLIGIWLVEHGEYAGSIGVTGSPNGATLAFATYALIVSGVAFAVSGVRRQRAAAAPVDNQFPGAGREYIHFSKNLLLLNLTFLFLMLFGFGGINVWLGTIEKGLFRATLGPFAALPYLLTKFAVPALFAYGTMLLLRTNRSRKKRLLWWANAFLVLLAGSTWGFKTTGIFMMLPALLILNWQVSAWRLAKLGAVFLASLVAFFFWFDAPLLKEGSGVVTFLAARLTVMQGDVAWYVWGLYQDAQVLPNYWPTLLAFAGDTMLQLFGIARDNQIEWMGYHYDWMITYLTGVSLETIASGHGVTATPFAEGVIAGGWGGVTLFAVIAGLLVGRTYFYLNRAIRRRYSATAAILSTYFCFHIFSWLNGGAITQLFHIATIVYLVVTVLLVKWMSLGRARRTLPGPQSIATLDTRADGSAAA